MVPGSILIVFAKGRPESLLVRNTEKKIKMSHYNTSM